MPVETEFSIELTAEDRTSAIVKKVQSKVEALAKSLRRLSTINVPNLKTSLAPSTSAQRAAGNFAREQQDAMRAFNRRFALE